MPDWDNQKAGTIFEQMLVKTSNKIDGVAAANDGLANAVVVALKAHKLKPIPLSGEDATAQGVQNIISGWQTMTVWKDTRLSATQTAKTAVALLKGQALKTTGKSHGVPAFIFKPVSITKSNYKQLFNGYLKKKDVCNGAYAKYCKGNGDVRGRRRSAPGTCRAIISLMNAAIATEAPTLELRGISKSFGSVQALADVDFEVRAGEVMALVGDNGAGKSTLIKCVAGIYTADSGEIFFDGKPVAIHGPRIQPVSESRSCTRISRSATTSTSSRTCSSGARPFLISSARYSDARHANATMLSVTFLSGWLTNGAASHDEQVLHVVRLADICSAPTSSDRCPCARCRLRE